MNTPLIDISPDQWAIVHKILQQHVPQHEVWAFGSRAQWTAKEYSDLDLVIITDKPLPLEISASLSEDFSESDLPWKVDIVDWATTSESFRKIIERDKVVVQESKRGRGIASIWKKATLDNVSSEVSYGYTESASGEKVGPHFLRITDIQNGIVNWSSVPYCPITAENHSKYRLQAGDIVIARTGNSTGENFLFRGGKDAVFASYLIRFRIDCQKTDPRFVWYNLRSQDWWDFINNSKTGSAQAGANARILGLFPLNLPPLDEQCAIASVLNSLDDKIDHNRALSTNLEAIARRLFKSWFVDFDPVRAKAAGEKPPGLADDIAALFPDRLVDSEMGEIPEGWVVQSLDGIAEFLNGLALQKFPATDPDDSLPVIKISEMRNGVNAKSDRASRDVPEKYIVKNGDFLFSWSGSLLAKFWTGGEGALNQHLFKVASEQYPMWFVGHWVYHYLEEFQMIAASKATTMGHIQRGHLKVAMTICPPEDILERLDVVMEPLVEQVIQCELESRTLTTLRDALLPKLISGEIRVSYAQAQIEEALA